MMTYHQLELYVAERRREIEQELERQRRLRLLGPVPAETRRPQRIRRWIGRRLVAWGTQLQQISLRHTDSQPVEETVRLSRTVR
ncbi:MAG: hypothetical protein H3C34_07070 [Caldilineaceae bacterium]|nr:hypothetical protein [Caldilineaceae bacterium]